mmetsp:Transcript_65359/g.156264  ORF Transcript_65359/g.156264 Transcript_65359/m.156264 type:complete len:190 (-) Transcript_65359:136-705(-)|eukprot:CAMPEP_0178373326 /NCGR_PEP_ID=MMETSP0689_2-20121128/1805_1 /TAXON_ID=160604 /ORGANISM="Amphidinium massartii, Strain CS-259" /LENGTH=189 /DNA_ID=CAMNT_0019993265 /DNA_START=35 /DNA_END=604 /DNA_ORIENTATION=-
MAPMEPDTCPFDDADGKEEGRSGGFRCHHCVREIGESETVYMRSDAWYCSRSCRKRGRSWQYMQWKAPGSDPRSFHYSPWSANTSSALSALTESSSRSSSSSAAGDEMPAAQSVGVLNWIVRKAVGRIVAIIGGDKLLRNFSASADGAVASPLLCQQLSQTPGVRKTHSRLNTPSEAADFGECMGLAPH